jgi:tRNA1(Val) A37 N6-methylase TrmN6
LVPDARMHSIDLVDRGHPRVIVADFLNYESDTLWDYIVTNPPYSLGKSQMCRMCTWSRRSSRHSSQLHTPYS